MIRKFKITKPIPFAKLVPSLLTVIGLIIGSSSVKFALDSRWDIAVYCILVAAFIDGIDGKIARLLNATSPFGAELDSLCDFGNFGLSTAYLMYLWISSNNQYKLLSWTILLLFVVCMAIRLARFNTSIQNKNFFTGVPAPCGAILALMPIIIDFEIGVLFNFSLLHHPVIINIYILFIGILLPSRLPTFSTKNIHINPEYLWILMISLGIMIIGMFLYTWYILPLLGFIYLLSIPISSYKYKIDIKS